MNIRIEYIAELQYITISAQPTAVYKELAAKSSHLHANWLYGHPFARSIMAQ